MPPFALTFSSESDNAASTIQPQQCEDILEHTELIQGDVLVRFLAFPVNPQDLMAIAGKYPVKPVYQQLDGSRIAGNDGVARIERVRDHGTPLKVGDLVLPKVHGLGTWRSVAVLPAQLLVKLPGNVDPVAAALLRMGFAPGYFLIEDLVLLRPGDWIVVNAALGVIPQMAIQFARLRGCHTVAVVRNRCIEDLEAARKLLETQGADVVITEEDLASHGAGADPALASAVQKKRIVLALDAVFGTSAEHLMRLLAPNATFVNYGSLGGADGVLQLTQELIFWKQIKFRNFRLSQQLGSRSDAEVEELLAWFVQLLAEGRLKVPEVDVVQLQEAGGSSECLTSIVRQTLDKAIKRLPGLKKQVFRLDEQDSASVEAVGL